MFRTTYIGHSGTMVELDTMTLLFDCVALDVPDDSLEYEAGVWPEIDPDKQLYVFVSHSHHDHYSWKIWGLRKQFPDTEYYVSKVIRLSASFREKMGLTDEDMEHVHRLKAGHFVYETDGLTVETLKSTDEGVAFFVTAEGKTIFHAGDLHLWIWEEEGQDYCRQMEQDFAIDVEPAAGKQVDLAFLILDPRLEETQYLGMDWWRGLMKIRHIVPIHMWKQYSLSEQYKEDRKSTPGIDGFCCVTGPGQIWEME